MKKPTIYDVSRMAGVSIATVSRVLNTPDKVNDQTRQLVLAAIRDLEYKPLLEARIRSSKDVRRICVMAPYFTAPSFVQRLRGVANALAGTNCELIVFSVTSLGHLNHFIETLDLRAKIDGLISLSLPMKDEYIGRVEAAGVEVVLVEYPQARVSSVEIDDFGGGRLAADFLLRKGHCRLGFVGDLKSPDYSVQPIIRRLSGFREGVLAGGCSLSDQQIYEAPYDVELTRSLIRDVLRRPDRPTAIFSATDMQALGVIRAARDMNLRVPQDIAVMGFDDLDLADYIGLTTIRQHLDESGRIAVELLLSRIEGPDRPVQHIHLPLQIVERDTV